MKISSLVIIFSLPLVYTLPYKVNSKLALVLLKLWSFRCCFTDISAVKQAMVERLNMDVYNQRQALFYPYLIYVSHYAQEACFLLSPDIWMAWLQEAVWGFLYIWQELFGNATVQILSLEGAFCWPEGVLVLESSKTFIYTSRKISCWNGNHSLPGFLLTQIYYAGLTF